MDKLLPCPCCPDGKGKLWAAYDGTYCVQCDKCGLTTLHKFSKQDVVAAWNRRRKPENKPLTLDELREMDGGLVWIRFLNSKASVSGQRHLVRNIKKEAINCFENYMSFCNYGKTWLAYRYKPEEEHHDAD